VIGVAFRSEPERLCARLANAAGLEALLKHPRARLAREEVVVMRRLGMIVALCTMLGMLGGAVTAVPALAGGRGDGWHFAPLPAHFPVPAVWCGFGFRATVLTNKSFVKALKSPDGSTTLLTGSVKLAFTNPANGKRVTANVSGPTKFMANPDGSATVLGKGHQLLSLTPAEQARFGLPGFLVFAGALTGTLAPDGSLTSLSPHGHLLVDVCAALS
jgi:hypothetical protein